MPLPVERGEVWLADLGMVAKVRPSLSLSVRPGPADRVLYALVPHTTSLRGSAYEVSIPTKLFPSGAFNVQGLVTVARPRLIRRLGLLTPAEVTLIETAVRVWLGI